MTDIPSASAVASTPFHGQGKEKDEVGVMMSSTHTRCTDSLMDHQSQKNDEILSRPILVGYAFGPKKMSTMGVVMAEASKTHLSSVSTTVLVEEDEEDEVANEEEGERDLKTPSSAVTTKEACSPLPQSPQQSAEPLPSTPTAAAKSVVSTSTASRPSPRRSTENSNSSSNIMMSLGSYNGGLQNIVRYLHSSCSSVDTNSTTTTMLTTGTTGLSPSTGGGSTCGKFGGGGASISGRSSATGGGDESSRNHQRLRVSFVPLDPDFPLEGQHGAKMDIILHKLTEDILCLSKYAPLYPDVVPRLGNSNTQLLQHTLQDIPSQDAQAAILRVHRLMQYQKKHPDCCLTDDPAKVLTLMSRSDIAHALQECLVGVQSASGIPVSSPRFMVWDPNNNNDNTKSNTTIAQCLQEAQLSYPLIAKPLQAAGTKISHYMTVLLRESGLEHIQQDSTCRLLQEYANHDAVLYKVYVLGNNVRVYQRPSLPNLPPLSLQEHEEQKEQLHYYKKNCPSYVDFDSQRPYPRLAAFGVKEGDSQPSQSQQQSQSQPSPRIAVTAEEVQPIVDKLKEAFGLELFGFDILITSSSSNTTATTTTKGHGNTKKMLVVDVNYFPSYKEMLNFPSLLAQYLTQRAIDSRRQQPSRVQVSPTT